MPRSDQRRLLFVGDEPHLEPRPLHGEVGQLILERRREPARRLPSSVRERPRLSQETGGRLGQRLVQDRGAPSAAGQRRVLGGQRLAARDHLVQRRSVLALQAFEQRQAVLDFLQPSRRRVDAVAEIPQRERQVFELAP